MPERHGRELARFEVWRLACHTPPHVKREREAIASLTDTPAALCAQCPSNSTLRSIVLLPGHWRLSDRTTDVRPCGGSTNCSGCMGGTSSGGCAAGRGGPLCQICTSKDEYFAAKTASCAACPDWDTQLLFFSLVAAGVVVLMLFVLRMSRKQWRGYSMRLLVSILRVRCHHPQPATVSEADAAPTLLYVGLFTTRFGSSCIRLPKRIAPYCNTTYSLPIPAGT